MVTNKKAQASQSEYRGTKSSVGSEVRQVVTYAPQFSNLFARLLRRAVATFKVERNLLVNALVPRGFKYLRRAGSGDSCSESGW
jgi:hypothetical protein